MADEKLLINDLSRSLNLSRTTLLYYESLGIVKPRRDGGTRWRTYDFDDHARLINAITAKNLGVAPKNLAEHLEHGYFSDENVAEYLDSIEKGLSYLHAQRESLLRLDALIKHVGWMGAENVEPYYICFDGSERGFSKMEKDETSSAMILHLPITSIGSVYSDDWESDDWNGRWGRTVPTRFAHLVPRVPDTLPVIGGGACLCRNELYRIETWDEGRDRARALMYEALEAEGLELAGQPFCPYSAYTSNGTYVRLCWPVRRRL